MIPLVVPDNLPPYARQYLAQLDDAISKTVHDASVTSQSYRNAAELYRQTGNAWEATGADEAADRIDLDPRLHVADVMRSSTPNGTAKMMLHQYIELLEQQTRQNTQRAA